VFNQLFLSGNKGSSDSHNTITKPHQLPWFQDFIQTNAQTLKAYLLLTVDDCRSCQTIDLKSLLEIKTFGDVATVHLKAAPLAPANADLTKFEVERIIDGYPPFYRSIILTPGPKSYQITHPTKESHHLSRGSWVLAVGLSINIGRIPSLYNMQQLRWKNDEIYWKGTLVMSAFDMIGRSLSRLRDFEELRLNWTPASPPFKMGRSVVRSCIELLQSHHERKLFIEAMDSQNAGYRIASPVCITCRRMPLHQDLHW
jgi:hypothetical protein